MKILRFLLLSLFLLSQNSFADLDAGKDLTVGDYIVDFGYSPSAPKANEPAEFAFNFLNKTTLLPVDTDKVLVRVSDKEKVLFAGTMILENHNVAFTYTFEKAGNYTVDAKFYKNDNILASAVFDLSVVGDNNIAYAAIFLVILALAAFFIKAL